MTNLDVEYLEARRRLRVFLARWVEFWAQVDLRPSFHSIEPVQSLLWKPTDASAFVTLLLLFSLSIGLKLLRDLRHRLKPIRLPFLSY